MTSPSFAPTVFICHHSKDLNSVQDTAKHFSTQMRDGCHFGFARTPTGAQNEGQFLHRSVPSVTKPATENAFILCPLQSLPSPPPRAPSTLERRKKLKFTSRTFEYLLCGPGKTSRLPWLKTLESAYMHRGLGRRGRFTSRRPVTHTHTRRPAQDSFTHNTFLPQRSSFYLKRFLRGKDFYLDAVSLSRKRSAGSVPRQV